MCGLDCCGKALLVLINVIFLIIGLLLLVSGVMFKTAFDLFGSFLSGVLQSVLSIMGDNADPSALESLLDNAGWALIVLGIIALVTAVLGCCGACCSVRCMLIGYSVAVLAIFLFKLIGLILVVTGTLDADLQARLQTVINKEYGGIKDTEPASLAFNALMVTYKCCGINSCDDFNETEVWDNQLPPEYALVGDRTMVCPVACCVLNESKEPVDAKCVTDPNDDNSYWRTGCWQTIASEIDGGKDLFIGIFAGVLAIELVCAAVAICLTIRFKKHRVTPV